MGSSFTKILTPKTIDSGALRRKTLAVDAFNTLYMFLTTIRGRDGSPLTSADGTVTSHLVGIFNRFTTFLEKDMKFVFIFDGKPPELKRKERARRRQRKEKAKKQYREAKKEGDIKNMKKYAARTTFLSPEMQKQAKELIQLMGMDVIDAPSEGKAQAEYLTKQGDAYAVVSQDADSLLNGATRVVRNLNITGRRKKPGKYAYKQINTELYELAKIKQTLEMTQDQLIALAMLVGTDYNYGGIKGIGPKRGVKKVKKHGEDFEALFEDVAWADHCDYAWRDVFSTIKNIPVKQDYTITTGEPQYEAIQRFLMKYQITHNIESTLTNLKKKREGFTQSGLSDFL